MERCCSDPSTCVLGELSLHRGLPDLLGEETGCFKTLLWNGGILHIGVTFEVLQLGLGEVGFGLDPAD